MTEPPACPVYAINDTVRYTDRQSRSQTGRVLWIEAYWSEWKREGPLILYALEHPTYQNRRFVTSADRIAGLAPTPTAEEVGDGNLQPTEGTG